MAFQKFTKTGRSYAPRVSIWSRGQIGFAMGAVRRYKIDQHSYAILYYDPDTRRIGFKFTDNGEEAGASKLNVRDSGAVVGAKGFLEYYGIDYNKTRQYVLEEDEESGLFVIELDKAIREAK